MKYHPLLDTAPSSVASILLTLVGSFLSILGCMYVGFRLHRIKYRDSFSYWRTRHYLLFMLTLANFAAALSALISGLFYLVFGRLASVPGCTLSGMTEFWAQQAVDVSVIVIALATFASVFHKAQWMRHRHWIQTNMAPVFGMILFLPLVTTIASQIIWRFRSSEFAYCWIPRHPVYARWVASDGWRTLTLLVLLLGYLRMARRLRTQPQLQISWPTDRPAIDSAMASAAAPAGLFSQSMYNASRWARSKIGRQPVGLRSSGSSFDSIVYGTRHARHSYVSDTSAGSDAANGQTRTYVQLTRSFVSNLVRRFITTDIPSPTIAQSIFDRIASSPHECRGAAGACVYCPGEAVYCKEEQEEAAGSAGAQGGLRRWYSALTGMLGARAAGWPLARGSRRQSTTFALRRSHTAPVLSSDAMGLGSRVFSRPAATQAATASTASDDVAHDNTLIMTEYVDPLARHNHHYRGLADAKARDDEQLAAKIHRIFGQPPAIPPHAIHRVSIRQDGPPTAASSKPGSSARSSGSVALEEGGRWADAVAKCRGHRHSHVASEHPPRMSRLYVYPLAHMLLWLPPLIYCFVSTLVYYQAFEKPRDGAGGRLWKRDADFSELPAGWTDDGHNMGRAWPYFLHFAQNVPASGQLGWLAIVQSLHMLGGAVDAVLFWMTEQ
ncbi:hypothetical protein LPJ53_004409 [Coemansia erecta]|uniref:Glucose receptor Git3 N-terminal domain-containing protein n=1 Tax=Coemansia erecta TaxID=147472 RepID=A0A9W8CRD5_9FUNG|nr:hypothetical protein LPJ53_004409 [Coemansia erecta]